MIDRIYLLQLSVMIGDLEMTGVFDTLSAHLTRESAEKALERVRTIPAFSKRRLMVVETPVFP